MTIPRLRVPVKPPPTGYAWHPVIGSPAGWVGSDMPGHAVYYNGHTYLGFIDLDGNAKVASYNHTTNAATVSPAIVSSGLVGDIHCTPSVLVRSSDHKLVVAVAAHSNTPAVHMYVAISTNAEDVSAWGAATDIKSTLGGTAYTYAHLVQLSGESGKIYLFYRDEQSAGATSALCYSTSTDGGATWTAQTTLYANSGKQSYWVIDTDDTSRIDFAVSDGNASDGDAASCYHFSYSGGSYFKSDGTLISVSLPLGPTNLTKIYDSSNGHVRIPYSIRGGAAPVVALAAYDPAGSGSNEKYWYCAYSAGSWGAHTVVDMGSPPTSGFSDGGIAIDKTSTDTVYVSRLVTSNWQIVKYATSDGGSTWTSIQLSSDPGLADDTYNLRPVSPHNAATGLRAAWCFGPHFVDGTSSLERSSGWIRGYPNLV